MTNRTTPNGNDITTLVSSDAYKNKVTTLVRANIAKGSKIVVTDDILANYRDNEIVKGLTGKNESDAIIALETEAVAARSIASSLTMRGIELGQVLFDAKRRVGHGNWTNYCQMRIGLNMKQVQRAMNAAKSVTLYPKLLEVVDNVNDTIFTEIGTHDDLTPEQVDELYEVADKGVLDIAKARDILKGAAATKSVPALPFTKVSQENAAFAAEQVIEALKRATEDISAESVSESIKHPNFTKWMQALGRKPESELQTELRKVLIFAWMLEESLYAPDTLVAMPEDGSAVVILSEEVPS